MTASRSGFHTFHVINKSGHVLKIFHASNAVAFLGAQLMGGPLGCSGRSGACSFCAGRCPCAFSGWQVVTVRCGCSFL